MPVTRPGRRWRVVVGTIVLAAAGSGSAEEADIGVGLGRFRVELAATPEERQQGLMFREHLPPGRGMLFVQPRTGPATFWMKNTRIPLDMLFFDPQGRLLEIIADVPPCTTPRCPVYSSDGPVKYVLELNAGTARRLGLKPGDQLRRH